MVTLELSHLKTFVFQTGFQVVHKEKELVARTHGSSTQLALKEEQSQRCTSLPVVMGE